MLDPQYWTSIAEPKRDATFLARVELEAWEPEDIASLTRIEPQSEPVEKIVSTAKLHGHLVAYFLHKRIEYQMGYARRVHESMSGLDGRTRMWVPVLFFGVITFVVAHVVVDVAMHYRGTPDGVSIGLSHTFVALAAVLPALGAAVHTYRSSREYGRNGMRQKADFFRTERDPVES